MCINAVRSLDADKNHAGEIQCGSVTWFMGLS